MATTKTKAKSVKGTRTFSYELLGEGGKRAKKTIEAPSENAARQLLRQQGVVPLSMSESTSVLQKEISFSLGGGRVKLKDLAVFTRQFATMTTSGLTLMRSLSVLEQQASKPAMKTAIAAVRLDIEAGVPLSAAMAKHERVFPALMVAMIKAGETGGFLDEALDRIAVNFEKDAALRAKTKSAMTYPIIVLAFTVLLVTGVLIFIVPVFEKMFRQFGSQLPLPTQLLVNASHAMVWAGPLTVALVAGGVYAFRRQMRRNPRLRLRFDTFKLRLPVFGPLFTKIAISRFARSLGTLLSVGVPVMQALDVVGATSGNATVVAATKDIQDAVRDGRPMSAPLADHAVFPMMVGQMIEVGEESGQISQMLGKLADFYDREVDSAAESLTSSIEPVMVLLMGGVIGSMVVCLYLPMFTIYQKIQGVE